MTQEKWPHWLPRPKPSIELTKEQGEYLLGNRVHKERGNLIITRLNDKPNQYHWFGSKSELNSLLRYFD